MFIFDLLSKNHRLSTEIIYQKLKSIEEYDGRQDDVMI
jgi:hypothetical protein